VGSGERLDFRSPTLILLRAGGRSAGAAASGARLTLDLRRLAFAFLSWLALAVVLAPALDPVGSPLVQTSGSAFNVFTSDVSLGPSRAAAPERDRKLQTLPTGGPDDGGRTIPAAMLPSPPAVPAVPGRSRPAWTLAATPAPGDAAAAPFNARAPPLSGAL